MLKKILKTFLIAGAACAALTVSALAANEGGGIVTASALNLRSEATTESSILTTAPRGTGFVIREIVNDQWYRVWYRGTEGYMASQYVRTVDNLEGNVGQGTIRGTSVRMRDGASLTSNTLGYYNEGTTMSVIGVFGEWYKVKYNDTVGFVHSDYMTISYGSASGNTSVSAPVVGSSSNSLGQKIVDTAMKYMGVPYVWAGTSPSGFDCSGFVYYVYKECGYSINRTAESIYYNGTYVDKANLQIGDTVHFTTSRSNGIGHVGIYIGDDKFIHASSGTGYVTITSLNTNYYTVHYYGARRII